MMNADYKKMKQCIMEALSQKTGFDQDQSGCFSYEIYPDYRDEMDNATASTPCMHRFSRQAHDT